MIKVIIIFLYLLTGDGNEAQGNGSYKQRKFLTNEECRAISHLLLQSSSNGKLNKGATKMVASLYSVSIRVIQRIWKQTKEIGDASHKKEKNCGRNRVHIDLARFREIPLSK